MIWWVKKVKRHVSISIMLKTWLFYFHQLLAVSISTFASLVCAPVGITSFAVGIKLCGIIARIKKCKSII